MAIGIRLKRVADDSDIGASKLFGTPTVPPDIEYYDGELFFCQIRLSDISELDKEGILPHSGYLYVFLDVSNEEHPMSAEVRYFDGEPTVAIDGFNSELGKYSRFTDDWIMEFYKADDDADCTRLLGVPTDWNYEDTPPRLLMQYDPLDNETGFLDEVDGFMYLVMGNSPTDVSLIIEYS